jgi:pheromone shutdown protein TraB
MSLRRLFDLRRAAVIVVFAASPEFAVLGRLTAGGHMRRVAVGFVFALVTVIVAVEDNGSMTSFVVDDFAIVIEP